jgi:hypothetical protein
MKTYYVEVDGKRVSPYYASIDAIEERKKQLLLPGQKGIIVEKTRAFGLLHLKMIHN